MVPSMLGENLRRRTGVSDVISQISFKWNWAGHVAPMTAGRWTKIWLEREPIEEVEEDRSRDGPTMLGRWKNGCRVFNRRQWKILGEDNIQQWIQRAA